MATDWEERSDAEYDVEHMSHPRRLAQEQLVSAADGTPMVDVKQTMGGQAQTVKQADGAIVPTTKGQ